MGLVVVVLFPIATNTSNRFPRFLVLFFVVVGSCYFLINILFLSCAKVEYVCLSNHCLEVYQ